MSFWKWHEKLVHKINEKNLKLAITGKIITYFALGSIFSRFLVEYSYFILIASALISIHFVQKCFFVYYKKEKLEYSSVILGFIGALLLILLFGIQSPQIPFVYYILGFGVLMVLPGTADLFKK